MAVGKKAIVFTLMAIVISSVLVVSGGALRGQAQSQELNPEIIRVKIIDGLIGAFFSYANGALRTSTHAAFTELSIALGEQSDENFILYYEDFDEFQTNLQRCTLGQTGEFPLEIGGSPIGYSCPGNISFPALLDEFRLLVLDTMNANITYTLQSETFSVSEEIPFEAIVTLTIDVHVSDAFAEWDLPNQNITVYVPLEGVQDPLTSKLANNALFADIVPPGFEPYTFEKTNITQWNLTTTIEMLNAKTYRWQQVSTIAPSILDRYIGDLDNSTCCGVEAFIDGTHLTSAKWQERPGTQLKGSASNYSFVDHELLDSLSAAAFRPQLFYCSGPNDLPKTFKLQVGGLTTDNFWLNQSVLARYNVSGANWTSCE